MPKPLLEALFRGEPEQVSAWLAGEPEPVGALRARALRAYVRDLTSLGCSAEVAQFLARRTLTALHRVLADPDVTLADQTAACLVAERVLVAAVSSLVGVAASTEDAAASDAPQPPPLVD